VLSKYDALCVSPLYAAEDLLRAEGFTDLEYLPIGREVDQVSLLGSGLEHFDLFFMPELLPRMEEGVPIKILSGIHGGCFELFASDAIRGITDLKGKTVGVPARGSTEHLLVSLIAAHVGLDPDRDINWVEDRTAAWSERFAEGEVDAFLGFPPDTQKLRAQGVGHAIVNSVVDRPWCQYFCCFLAANANFVEENPVATKRVLRAVLKATDLCRQAPRQVAAQLVERGFAEQLELAVQALTELDFGVWRELDPEDTVRFYAVRLHELGMITTTPSEIIAHNADWRFLEEIKRELKV
jgi:NitT/TauT family transport system substrate-binding protein